MAIKIIDGAKDTVKGWLGWRKEIEPPAPEAEAVFLLTYGDLIIGRLSAKQGLWQFEYSDEFRLQDDLRPILEMPDVQKTYRSPNLWQFFAMRIPSLGQPDVEEILEREHILETDSIRLLDRFGKRTIANPFELKLAA